MCSWKPCRIGTTFEEDCRVPDYLCHWRSMLISTKFCTRTRLRSFIQNIFTVDYSFAVSNSKLREVARYGRYIEIKDGNIFVHIYIYTYIAIAISYIMYIYIQSTRSSYNQRCIYLSHWISQYVILTFVLVMQHCNKPCSSIKLYSQNRPPFPVSG